MPPGRVRTQLTLVWARRRCATFFYEVVCAFVLSDLEGLAMRYMRKSAASLIKVAE